MGDVSAWREGETQRRERGVWGTVPGSRRAAPARLEGGWWRVAAEARAAGGVVPGHSQACSLLSGSVTGRSARSRGTPSGLLSAGLRGASRGGLGRQSLHSSLCSGRLASLHPRQRCCSFCCRGGVMLSRRVFGLLA